MSLNLSEIRFRAFQADEDFSVDDGLGVLRGEIPAPPVTPPPPPPPGSPIIIDPGAPGGPTVGGIDPPLGITVTVPVGTPGSDPGSSSGDTIDSGTNGDIEIDISGLPDGGYDISVEVKVTGDGVHAEVYSIEYEFPPTFSGSGGSGAGFGLSFSGSPGGTPLPPATTFGWQVMTASVTLNPGDTLQIYAAHVGLFGPGICQFGVITLTPV